MTSENFDMNIESEPIDLAKKIVKEKFDLEVIGFSIINIGYGGQVFKLQTNSQEAKKKELVFKLSELADEPSFEEINNSDRIYGTRLSNLIPAYNLLKDNNIPVAEIFDSGLTNLNGSKQQYTILEYLSGISVREFLTESEDENIDDLHKATGKVFGKIHNIRRGHQGWIEMTESQSIDWKQSYFAWINSYFFKIKKENLFDFEKISAIEKYIENKRQAWNSPSEFVLSHMDGFQGIAQQDGSDWKITGVIDIEDHQFMDQRLVLAGHEVVLILEGKQLPDIFWEEYKKNTSLDDTYSDFKNLFMLSYLLAWRSIFEDCWHGKPEDRDPAIEKIAKLIDEFLKSN